MRHSIYIHLATYLIRIDLHREERQWRASVRRSAHDLPWDNPHLLRDIGFDLDGRSNTASRPTQEQAQRHMRHLRRILSMRIPT